MVKFDWTWAKIKILHPENIRSPTAMRRMVARDNCVQFDLSENEAQSCCSKSEHDGILPPRRTTS